MKMIKTIKVSLSSLCIGLCLLGSAANAGKLYKWVDAKGVVSYQDQPPPKGSKILSEKDVKSTVPSRSEEQKIKNKSLPNITIYTVEECDLCESVVTVLRKNQIPHIELSLRDDRDAQSKILSELGSLRAPSFIIGDKVFQTSSLSELRATLLAQGYNISDVEKASSEVVETPQS